MLHYLLFTVFITKISDGTKCSISSSVFSKHTYMVRTTSGCGVGGGGQGKLTIVDK